MEQVRSIPVVSDQFSSVFGTRRGSAAAQALRDRDESCAHIREHLVPEMKLTPRNLKEFYKYFASDNLLVSKTLREALLANMCSDGLGAVATALSFPTVKRLPSAAQELLRELVTELVGTISKENPSKVDVPEVNYLTRRTFSFASSPFPLGVAQKYQEMIQAASDFYRVTPMGLDTVVPIISSLASQPDSHLPLYEPLVEVVEDFVGKQDSQSIIDELFTALDDGGNTSPVFSRLISMVDKKKVLSPSEIAVLTHPVWDEKDFVTKEDLITRAHDTYAPRNAKSAQLILNRLNGGVSGMGTSYVTTRPGAIPGKRSAYRLSEEGQQIRSLRIGLFGSSGGPLIS